VLCFVSDNPRLAHSRRFPSIWLTKKFIPVALPPGRLRLATSPNLTGSSLLVNTIGIVAVACLAANADPMPPVAAMTLT
jgi:hypothetical protein